jgi:hypothetical protein
MISWDDPPATDSIETLRERVVNGFKAFIVASAAPSMDEADQMVILESLDIILPDAITNALHAYFTASRQSLDPHLAEHVQTCKSCQAALAARRN